jgi:acetolactate synthase I/II/III large subunit
VINVKGSDAIAAFLASHKIGFCFEVAGGMITHTLDSMAELGATRIISMHHEQAAAFAAEGVARASRGKQIAVAMGTSGPGATNLITGIGSCWLDSIPCLFITGQVNVNELKLDSGVRQFGFQELGICEMVEDVTKYRAQIRHVEDLMPSLYQALSLALDGRMGPSLLDIPNSIQREDVPESVVQEWIEKPIGTSSVARTDEVDLNALRELCLHSEKPLICLGRGAVWSDSLASWVSALQDVGIPYVSSLQGRQVLEQNEKYLGMLGTYGKRLANWAVQNCDLLISIGSRLDIRQTGANREDFARNAKIVRIDIDRNELAFGINPDLAIAASADNFFDSFMPSRDVFHSINPDWLRTISTLRANFDRDEYEKMSITPCSLLKRISCSLRDMDIEYVADVGSHQMWAAHSLDLGAGQQIHFSGGMGAMGFGLPAAIGVALSSGKKVINLTGDGSIQMNIQELDTVKRLNLNMGIIVLNNMSLGMIKHFQDMYFEGRNQSTKVGYSWPSFTKVARAFGIESRLVKTDAQMDRSLAELRTKNGPYLIEVQMPEAIDCRPRLRFGDKLDEQFPRPE